MRQRSRGQRIFLWSKFHSMWEQSRRFFTSWKGTTWTSLTTIASRIAKALLLKLSPKRILKTYNCSSQVDLFHSLTKKTNCHRHKIWLLIYLNKTLLIWILNRCSSCSNALTRIDLPIRWALIASMIPSAKLQRPTLYTTCMQTQRRAWTWGATAN